MQVHIITFFSRYVIVLDVDTSDADLSYLYVKSSVFSSGNLTGKLRHFSAYLESVYSRWHQKLLRIPVGILVGKAAYCAKPKIKNFGRIPMVFMYNLWEMQIAVEFSPFLNSN